MIKLSHPEWESQIELSPDFITTIAIENRMKFFEFVSQLGAQIDSGCGSYYFIQDDKSVAMNSVCEFIPDLVNFEINNKKTIGYLHKKLYTDIQNSPLSYQIINAVEVLKTVFNDAAAETFVPIMYNDDVDLSALLKLFNVRIQTDERSLLEKLVSYIDIMTELKNVRVFILLFAKAYLSNDNLTELQKHCCYKEVCLLLFEPNGASALAENERMMIIDDDLCEILVKFT